MPSRNGGAVASLLAVHSQNTRLGLALFLVYLQQYVGLALLCTLIKSDGTKKSIGGMNFAVVCVFGLIIEAGVLALIYLVFCKAEPAPIPELTEGELAVEAQKEEGSRSDIMTSPGRFFPSLPFSSESFWP